MVIGGTARLLARLETALVEGEVVIDETQGSEEDVVDLKHATSPPQPSAEQVERHRVDHNPYRSWCKWCIMGRGQGRPHATTGTDSTVPIVGMDYFFVTKEGV